MENRTGHVWKLITLAGLGLVIWGMVLFFPAVMFSSSMSGRGEMYREYQSNISNGVALFVVGWVVLLVGRLGRWWFYE